MFSFDPTMSSVRQLVVLPALGIGRMETPGGDGSDRHLSVRYPPYRWTSVVILIPGVLDGI